MKTLNRITKQVLLVSVAAVAATLVACGKKNDSSNGGNIIPPPAPAPGIVGPGGCNGCPGNQQLLLRGVQTTSSVISMGLDAYGDGAYPVNWNDPKVIVAYFGPLTLVANARVTNLCGANGDYSVRMVNPGVVQWGGAISGRSAFSFPSSPMLLEATSTTGGGPTILIQVHSGEFYGGFEGLSRDGQSNRVGLNLGFLVGGQPCPGIATY